MVFVLEVEPKEKEDKSNLKTTFVFEETKSNLAASHKDSLIVIKNCEIWNISDWRSLKKKFKNDLLVEFDNESQNESSKASGSEIKTEEETGNVKKNLPILYFGFLSTLIWLLFVQIVVPR